MSYVSMVANRLTFYEWVGKCAMSIITLAIATIVLELRIHYSINQFVVSIETWNRDEIQREHSSRRVSVAMHDDNHSPNHNVH